MASTHISSSKGNAAAGAIAPGRFLLEIHVIRQTNGAGQSAPPAPAGDSSNDNDGDDLDLIRLPEVMRRTGLCRAMIYRLMGKKAFPSSVPITLRATGWVRGEIKRWNVDRIRARDSASRTPVGQRATEARHAR
jgi:prophage regulatory protein